MEELQREREAQSQTETEVVVAHIDEGIQHMEIWYGDWQNEKYKKEEVLVHVKGKSTQMLDSLHTSETEKVSLMTTLHEEIRYREQNISRIEKLQHNLGAVVEDEEFLSEIAHNCEVGREIARKSQKTRDGKFQKLKAAWENAKGSLARTELDAKEQLSRMNESKQRQERIRSELGSQTASLRDRIPQKKSVVDELVQQRMTKESKIRKRREDNDERERQSANAYRQHALIMEEHRIVENRKSDLAKDILTKKEHIVAHREILLKLETESLDIEAAAKLTGDLSGVELSTHMKAIEDLDFKLVALKQKVTETESKDLEMKAALVILKNGLTDLNVEITEVDDKISALVVEKTMIVGNVRETETQLETAKIDLATAKDTAARKLKNLEDSFSTSEKRVTLLKTRKSAAEVRLGGIRTECRDWMNSVNELKKSIRKTETEIKQMETMAEENARRALEEQARDEAEEAAEEIAEQTRRETKRVRPENENRLREEREARKEKEAEERARKDEETREMLEAEERANKKSDAEEKRKQEELAKKDSAAFSRNIETRQSKPGQVSAATSQPVFAVPKTPAVPPTRSVRREVSRPLSHPVRRKRALSVSSADSEYVDLPVYSPSSQGNDSVNGEFVNENEADVGYNGTIRPVNTGALSRLSSSNSNLSRFGPPVGRPTPPARQAARNRRARLEEL